uniref:hypothetical protein n=1 Tax=Azospirillum argentinense TaxID=2970906 RepID=UPI0010BFDBB7|nr:hypothetical protein [Azospirillum argentinense]
MLSPERTIEDRDAGDWDAALHDRGHPPDPVAGTLISLAAAAAPADTLRRFRLSHADLMPTVRRLELDWPCSVAMMQRFAEYVTGVPVCHPRDPGSRSNSPIPVLFLCLQKGLGAYDAAAYESDDRRLLAFVDGLCQEAARLLSGIALFTPDNACWMAGNGTALHGWLATCDARGVTVHRSQRRGASHQRVLSAIGRYVILARERAILERVRRADATP